MKCKLSIIITALLGLFVAAAGEATGKTASSEPVSLSFGIVPQQAPSKLLQSWGPVLKWLQRRTGYQFVFRTAPDIPTFEQRLAAGEYDFAYMNPYHFTVFNKGDTKYQAVAKAKNKRIQGILVVRKDSPITSPNELRGKTLAFPAPAAFAASVLIQAHLKAEQIPFDARYVSSHDSVYRAVAGSFFVAGGGVIRTFASTDPKVREQLRILWTTPGYTPHAIAAHTRLDAAVVSHIQQALSAIGDDAGGRAALARLKVKGFERAANSDWDDVRALQIDTELGKTK